MNQPVSAQEKRLLRQEMKERRDKLGETEQTHGSEQVREHALTYIRGLDARSVMLYLSFRSEVRTDALIESLWAEEIEVIVPISNPYDRSLSLYRLRSWDQLITGAYGIREPDSGLAEPCGSTFVPDLVIVPGLAFDRKGGRLGYGGGYYDRFHERLQTLAGAGQRRMVQVQPTDGGGDSTINIPPVLEPPWVGLAYEAQMVEQVPMQPHDASMNGVITEQGIWIHPTIGRG